MKLYEFSSSVIVYNPAQGYYEFDRYNVGQFMKNSFTLDEKIKTNDRGIPEVIDRAIRNDYFRVKTPSYPHLALTGRYLEDNWVVLAVSDQLAGRPNELYRYFCVKFSLTENVDPMLSLINWYLNRSPRIRFDPDPDRDLRIIDIPESLPTFDPNKLNKQTWQVLDKLRGGGDWNFSTISLTLEEFSNIIAALTPSERKTFSWAIGAYNFNSLIRSGNFRLVQNSNGDLWISSSKGTIAENIQPRTVDRQTAISTIKKLALAPKISEFKRLLIALFKQEVDEENWKKIFDNDIGLTARLNTDNPGLQDINLLVLQAILVPERVAEIIIFLERKAEKEYKKNFENIKKSLFEFERKVLRSLISIDLFSPNPQQSQYFLPEKQENYWVFSKLIEQVYKGAWFCLENVLAADNNSKNFIVEGFLQHENSWLSKNLFGSDKRANEGLWEWVLISKIRFDFYNHIKQIYPPSQPASSFFSKFIANKCKQTLDFLKRLWQNDPIITTWLHLQAGDKIPNNTFKTIEHLKYSSLNENVLLKDFFFPRSHLQPASRWELILKRLK